MNKIIKTAYAVIISTFSIFVVLKLVRESIVIPGISDAPFYVFLAFMAPFLAIGFIAKGIDRKANPPENEVTINPETGETEKPQGDPSFETVKYSKKDWLFTGISVIKIPIIMAAVFGALYFFAFIILYLIKHLTN